MDELNSKIENLKTNNDELDEVLEKYDLDEQLEEVFNTIDARFHRLEIKYQSLINTRRFLNNG